MKILRASFLYFGIVFGMGFLFGVLRTVLFVPRFGTRVSELCEMPLMVVVIYCASKWLVKHYSPSTRSFMLGVGFLSLGLMIGAELLVGMALRGLTLAQILTDRDPLVAVIYYSSLLMFGGLPSCLTGREGGVDSL